MRATPHVHSVEVDPHVFLLHRTDPKQILRELSNAEGVDWAKCRFFFADERCVPLDHKDR